MADTRPTFDSAREQRLRFLLAEFALGVPSGKQFDCDEMRLLRDDLDAMLGEIDRLNRALNEIIALDEKGPAWEPYDEFGDPSDIDVSNSGDQRRHGAWTAYQWAARIARAARTQPEGSNAPTSR